MSTALSWLCFYVAGQFTGTVDFDPGTDVYTLNGSGAGYIAKYDSSGNLLWARSPGLPGPIAIDGSYAYYVYSTGYVNGYLFVEKLDANGLIVWTRFIGGNPGAGIGFSPSAAVGPAGNLHIGGTFSGTVQFGSFTLTGSSTTPNISDDTFIIKLDAVGNVLWASQLRAMLAGASDVRAEVVAVDADGEVYSAGGYSGPVDFDPGPGVVQGFGPGTFVSKLDSAGRFLSRHGIQGSNEPFGRFDVVVGPASCASVYLTDTFDGSLSSGMTSAGGKDVYLARLGFMPGTGSIFHPDADADGYGDPGVAACSESSPPGYVVNSTDCNDAAAEVHPGASETCNGVDDDCDMVVDNGGASLCNDQNACTADVCDGTSGCAHPALGDGTPCSDAGGCTVGETCRSGVCEAPLTTYQPTESPFPVGGRPFCVAAADLNGDGKLDLATANFSTGNATILLGNGAGVFTSGSTISVGTQPRYVVVGDWNRDGHPDLAVANSNSGTVTIHLGNGSGGFSQSATVSVGGQPLSIAADDLNGDGKLDLAVANFNNVAILLGNGAGGFSPAPASPVTAGTQPHSVTMGDLNGDGKLDLAVANFGSNNISILLGNGSGAFSLAGSPMVGTNPDFVTAADFNGDARLDLAVANYGSNNVTILLGGGTGAFTPAGAPIMVGTNPRAIAVADLNGDALPDLAVANGGSNNITALLAVGGGQFVEEGGSPIGVGMDPEFVAAGDVNRDGRKDLLVANDLSNSVTVVVNNNRSAPDGTPCNDGNSCDGHDSCHNGVCYGTFGETFFVCNLCPEAPSGLVGWWPAEGLANDISASGNHGTLTNGATFAPGEVGQAFSLDGVDDRVAGVGSASSYAFVQNTGIFTIAAWINLSDVNAVSEQAILASTGDPGDKGFYFLWDNQALMNTRGLDIVLERGMSNSDVIRSASPSNVITTNGWHHVAVKGDGTNVFFYVDGVEYAGTGTMGTKSNGNSTRPVDIGDCAGFGSCQFHGLIDEVQIYNRALSASEIQSIYNALGIGQCRCTDADGDGYGAQGGAMCPHGFQQDCDDSNAAVWSPPIEVAKLSLSGHLTTTLTWFNQAQAVGSGITYDLLRGGLAFLPVGTGSESCLSSSSPTPSATDSAVPTAGSGYWYLVRGRNTCGVGTYGNRATGGVTGAQEVSSACP